jgi:hypothetical protein
MDKWHINSQINETIDKLKLVANPRETTPQEMVLEFRAVVKQADDVFKKAGL